MQYWLFVIKASPPKIGRDFFSLRILGTSLKQRTHLFQDQKWLWTKLTVFHLYSLDFYPYGLEKHSRIHSIICLKIEKNELKTQEDFLVGIWQSDVTKLVDSMITADVEEGLEAHRFDANNLQLSRYDVSIPYAADNIDMDDVNDYDGQTNLYSLL